MAEQNQIQGALKNVDSTTQDYFVGLRENRQGEFSWSDGSPIDFVYWADGQPNDQSGSQQCVKMSKIYSKWSDVNCGHEYGYVCARMKAIPQIPESKQHCSEGWLEYDDQCYKFSEKNADQNWTTALDSCKLDNGDLASIHSAYAMAFIFAQSLSYSEGSPWIGLHDQDQGSTIRLPVVIVIFRHVDF